MSDELTVRQAAELLRISRYRVHALIQGGQLPAARRETRLGTPYLVLRSADVAALADERRKIVAGQLAPRGGRKPNPPREDA